MDTAYVRETPPLKQPKNVIGYSTSICPVGGSPSVYSKSQTSKDLEVLVSNRSSAQASIVEKKYPKAPWEQVGRGVAKAVEG